MNRLGFIGSIVVCAALANAALASVDARVRRPSRTTDTGVPSLDVKGSCADAQKFSTGDDKSLAYKGCMQDEKNAKDELAKRWSSFKAADRSNCVEQARFPSPSYVEVLTCLEMDSGSIRSAPAADSKSGSQIGGPVAPGLTNTPSPGQ